MRGTIAVQIFFALVLIAVFSLVARALNMQALGWLLSRLTDIWVIAFIILFQPEIRRLLLIIGSTRVARLFLRMEESQNVNEIAEACFEVRNRGWGALIIVIRSTIPQNILQTGESLQAKINKELLVSLFNPKSPLHDGAVIIHNNRIEAARCILPLSETERLDSQKFGTRHRAGLGITEASDALSIIVSEERKIVSIAENGKLVIVKDINDLKEKLRDALEPASVAKSVKTIMKDAEQSFDSAKKVDEKKEE